MPMTRGSCRAGVGEPRGQRRDRLPADEGEHEGRRRRARPPASRAGRTAPSWPRATRRPSPATATMTTTSSSATSSSWAAAEVRSPPAASAMTASSSSGGDQRPGQPAAAGELGDVAGADQADDRRPGDDPGQERPAGDRAGPRAEPGADVADDPARRGETAPEGRRTRPRTGPDRMSSPAQASTDAGPACGGGEPGEQQQAGPEQRADVERGAARRRQPAARAEQWRTRQRRTGRGAGERSA